MQLIIGFIVLIWIVSKIGFSGLLFLVCAVIVAGVVAAIIETSNKNKKLADAKVIVDVTAKQQIEIIKKLIARHIQGLSIKEKQLVTDDSYGLKNTSRWIKEKQRFIVKVIQPELNGDLLISEESIYGVIDTAVTQFRSNYPKLANTGFSEKITPIEYENHCADILKKSGWEACTTPATGDQGADVIAKKSGKKVVVQCKKYSKPVGNKAVQEAHAAKAFYGADKAVVVSNASYTASAQQAASRLGVLLVHHDELQTLNERI